ncbi:MAG TPA: threonine ammonia-lyase [Acidimicrobiales bacterium]|nr:threonine ammonia-lyase [Acidimicrobiales bacterium]
MITLADVAAARERLATVVRPTPVRETDSISQTCRRTVLLKPENTQRTGSYKVRGAYNHISQLPAGAAVVAASVGNHAQGVAFAASVTGRQATIFMPLGASLPKIDATRGYGAEVRLAGVVVDDTFLAARAHADATGAALVPPFDDLHVIAGQGTVGLEVADEAAEAEVVVVPIGGGGLIAGVATALAHTRPGVKVIGVEAEGAAAMAAAVAAGRPVVLDKMATMADGLAVRCVGELTLAHTLAYVDQIVTVTEEEISRAQLLLLERAKAVVEPAGAVGLAAVLAGKIPGRGPVCCILSGGNIDPLLLMKVIQHGLKSAGRYLVLRVDMADRPGQLARLSARLADLGLNILDVEHHRSGARIAFDQVEVLLTLEVRSPLHGAEIIAALAADGARVEVVR